MGTIVKVANIASAQSMTRAAMFVEGRAAFARGDYSAALRLWRLSARQGFATAQGILGLLYYQGAHLRQNYIQAVRWLRKSADQGDVVAQYNLGVMYYNGMGVQRDYAEAAKWIRIAADRGFAFAKYDLAVMIEAGRGVPQNYAEAMKWYRTTEGIGYLGANAQINIGFMYANGHGVSQDRIEALRWYRKASDQYLPSATVFLYAHELQQKANEPVDESRWPKRWPKNNIEDILTPSLPFNDTPSSMLLFMARVLELRSSSIRRASFGAGRAAFARHDYAAALRLWKPLARRGFASAQYNLGLMYDAGIGVSRDHVRAVKWYSKAADQSVRGAQFRLGAMYAHGRGADQDYGKAAELARDAAFGGYTPAYYVLGMAYAKGEGVTQDYVWAYAWLDRAVSRLPASDNEMRDKAIMRRDQVAAEMTAEQMADARRFASVWRR